MIRDLPSPPARRAVALSAVLLVLAGCGGDDTPTHDGESGAMVEPDGERIADDLRRERVVVHFAKERLGEAEETLAPLLERDRPAPRDLVTGAQIALRLGDLDGAIEAMERAEELAPGDPAALYTRARIALLFGEPEEAAGLFERVLEMAPEDPPTKIGLAEALYSGEDGEEEETLDRIRGLLEEVAALGIEDGLQWYVTAVYKRYRLAIGMDEPEEVQRVWADLWDQQVAQGYEASTQQQLDQGELARVNPPEPFGTFPPEAPEPLTYAEAEVLTVLPGEASEVIMPDVDGDRTPDVVAVVDGTLWVCVRTPEAGVGNSVLTEVLQGVTGPVRALDLNQRRGGDTLDLVAAVDGRLVIVEQSDDARETSWEISPVEVPALGGEILDLEPVDYDHDGDLDLFVVGAFGARILRNDGAGAAVDGEGNALPRGAWVDASETASLPDTPLEWCAIEDFDGDNDVDLMAGAAGAPALLFDSLRRGQFVEVGAARLGGMEMAREPALADFDGDGRPDVFVTAEDASTLLLQGPDGVFRPSATFAGVGRNAGEIVVADLDLDGALDVAWPTFRAYAAVILGPATGAPAEFTVGSGETGSILLARDVDPPVRGEPLGVELVRSSAFTVVARRALGPTGEALRLKFVGDKDNRQAVGAVLEVRSGTLYTRRFLRGDAATVGIGAAEEADVVRVTWPNGVVGQDLDVPAGPEFMLDNDGFGAQPEGLIGSCPFLYTWNGETFEFISDVIGITPLGLPMAPGMLVPPDHDEYVLVRGDQLVPDANGDLVLQFTEELREVTYLDRARLDVVDHPAGTAIYPNERFTFPPFPEPHTHVVESAAALVRATGSDGADWTDELRDLDFRHPAPFERLGGQYLGLAEPHFLEMEFDAESVASAERLRLVATGWFFWSDASVNIAAAGDPNVEFVPPTLQVPGPDGEWIPTGPPVGFPAGKTKTMVIDVTDIVNRDDPRIRIGSTLELYWDRIQLATCGDDAALVTHSLEPRSSELWSRGFSLPVPPERADQPVFFDWDYVEPRPRWDQHPGMYTRYGDVTPLLGEIDDRFVIMGSGDALTLRFDARELPPVPEGMVRDYLVFLDGWAKDRDPNTHEALEVEPLPFHGMSGYPYRPDESFPSDPEHEAWRREWNTRPAHRWIVPLSPAGEREWLEEATRATDAEPREAAAPR